MNIISFFLILILIPFILIPFVDEKKQRMMLLTAEFIIFLLTGYYAIEALLGYPTIFQLEGSTIIPSVSIVLDPLAAWFILLINFTFLTGALYGSQYMKNYAGRKNSLSIHWMSYLMTHAGLLAVCVVQNMLMFLVVWEIMAIGSFFLVIFESEKAKTLKAGMNYLIQSHIGILLLMIAFGWVYAETSSFSFAAIRTFGQQSSSIQSFFLMLLFFSGFAFKAGFVPFHTWLPHAHPAAPAHVSGVMSGVLIKIGIYGMLRMILFLPEASLLIGIFILLISLFTGIYGVMLAIVQHNLKTLLAYHSIENIGIIGMGIGIGSIGIGIHNVPLAAFGFAGALLHTLNHSLFKSLLFYGAGNVYQATHTVNIESLGGLIHKMPKTAFLFLIASLAISGLPPFNGFVSEFLIYSGLMNGMIHGWFFYILVFAISILSLSLIGGLAILCFTKAFGTIFLGTPRQSFQHEPSERSTFTLIPMVAIVALIVTIGIFPAVFIHALWLPVQQFIPVVPISMNDSILSSLDVIQHVGLASLVFLALAGFIWLIRYQWTKKAVVQRGETWGCGYEAPNVKMQYTASSFVRTYRKLAEPILQFHKKKKEINGIFPEEIYQSTHALDRIETALIHRPLKWMRYELSRFSFLQNGSLQFYIMYGLIFIIILIAIPFVSSLYHFLIHFFNPF